MRQRILPRPDAPLRGPYDAVIIGAGVHGLGLAYNLAKRGMTHLAVFDKSYLGSGASGRNTTLIRSAFTTPEWINLFQESVRLWEGLSAELGFTVIGVFTVVSFPARSRARTVIVNGPVVAG